MDKSLTHTLVRKQGTNYWMSKHVISKLGEDKVKSQGWEFVSEKPQEIMELKRKNLDAQNNPVGDIDNTEPVEIKAKKKVEPKIEVEAEVEEVEEPTKEKRKYNKRK